MVNCEEEREPRGECVPAATMAGPGGRGGVAWRVLILAALVASLLPAQETPEQQIIREIAIQGLRREKESDILARLRLKVGEVYDRLRVSEEEGRLYSLGKFRRVARTEVSQLPNGIRLTFVVEERPVIRAVRFTGRDALSERHLTNEPPVLRTRRGGLLNRSYLLQDRETLLEKYRAAGYLFTTVEFKVKEDDSGVAHVEFVIEEGTRVRIREIVFRGNESVSDGDLLGNMSTREKDFWFFGLLRPGFYDAELLSQDLLNIENYYRRIGYLDVRAELDGLTFDRRKERVTIAIRIREGPQYTFRGYRFRGNAVFSEPTLRGLMTAVPGQPFNWDIMQKDRQAILNYYGDRAYIFAQVEDKLEYSYEGHDVYVAFEIRENNETFIEEVKIRGNVKTQDRVIRRELEFYPGQRVDRSKMVKSQSNLARLQFFQSVNYTFEEGSSPERKDLVVNVVEQETGRLIVGFGVTSGFGVIGNFSITKRNFDFLDWPESFYDIPDAFTGAGQTLNLAAQPGTRRSLYRFTFIEPYLFDTRNALRVSASSLTILRDDYDEQRSTFAPHVSHAFAFDRDFVFGIGGRIENVEIKGLEPDAPTDAFRAAGDTFIAAANSEISYDKRLFDRLEGPYSGHNSVAFYEYGEFENVIEFQKAEFTNEFFYPVYTYRSGPEELHHIFSLSNKFGIIDPIDSEFDIPIFERFFLGGPNTVRGFRFRGLGPHENRNPVGGTAMIYGNVEYSLPIYRKMLRLVAFFDYGNLAPEIDDFDFDEMRYVVGGGLRINFPFFGQPLPIGLFLGKALTAEDSDRERLFLFTVGVRF